MQNILPEILRCLVPECPRSSAWFLTHPPPGVWFFYEPGVCTRIPFRSCSYPSGHWSAMNTPWFYLSGWSSSLSATDLVCLSEEELDHHYSCSSSLSAANPMPLSGEELVHHCHHVSVQIQVRCLLLHAVGSAFIVLCWVQVQVRGNVQVQGFMLGECRCAGMVLQPCYYV